MPVPSAAPAETHVSSVIVRALPSRIAPLGDLIAGLAGAEVHAASLQGKMIVTLEAPSEGETLGLIERIREMEGAIDVSLVYHECDPGEAGDQEEVVRIVPSQRRKQP